MWDDEECRWACFFDKHMMMLIYQNETSWFIPIFMIEISL